MAARHRRQQPRHRQQRHRAPRSAAEHAHDHAPPVVRRPAQIEAGQQHDPGDRDHDMGEQQQCRTQPGDRQPQHRISRRSQPERQQPEHQADPEHVVDQAPEQRIAVEQQHGKCRLDRTTRAHRASERAEPGDEHAIGCNQEQLRRDPDRNSEPRQPENAKIECRVRHQEAAEAVELGPESVALQQGTQDVDTRYMVRPVLQRCGARHQQGQCAGYCQGGRCAFAGEQGNATGFTPSIRVAARSDQRRRL